MTESSPRAILNSLIETCKDGERGLLHAAELVKSPALKTFFTHRFPLSDVMKAYDTFGNAARERALKVVLSNRG